jgi:hypothetical protein
MSLNVFMKDEIVDSSLYKQLTKSLTDYEAQLKALNTWKPGLTYCPPFKLVNQHNELPNLKHQLDEIKASSEALHTLKLGSLLDTTTVRQGIAFEKVDNEGTGLDGSASWYLTPLLKDANSTIKLEPPDGEDHRTFTQPILKNRVWYAGFYSNRGTEPQTITGVCKLNPFAFDQSMASPTFSYTCDNAVHYPYSIDLNSLVELRDDYSKRLFNSNVNISNVVGISIPIKFLSFFNGTTKTQPNTNNCNCMGGSLFPDFQISETKLYIIKITVPLDQFKTNPAAIQSIVDAHAAKSVPDAVLTRISNSLPKYKCNPTLGICQPDAASPMSFADCSAGCKQDKYTCNFGTYECKLDSESKHSLAECTGFCVRPEPSPGVPSNSKSKSNNTPVYIAVGVVVVFLVGAVMYYIISRKKNATTKK